MNKCLSNQDKNKNNVEYYTDPKIWESVKKYIPRNKILWCPFFNKKYKESYGTIKKLKELGFDIAKNEEDFFKYNIEDSICVDNPPFNLKRQVIDKLIKDDIPFILLLPNTIFSTKYIKEYSKNNKDFQFLMPLERIKYTTSIHKKTTIHTLFFCYKINLSEKIVFI